MSKAPKLAKQKTATIYVNTPQARFLNSKAKRRTFIAGRGAGKTTTMGMLFYLQFCNLPRLKILLAGLTYVQIKNITWPAIAQALGSFGLIEHTNTTIGHYVFGIKPPTTWLKPYAPPKEYTHAVTFINGFTIILGSLDRPDLIRGGSYSGVHLDESGLTLEDHFTKIILPTIRERRRTMAQNPFWGLICDYTSVPWLPSGQWVFKTEELQKLHPDKYLLIEATAYDNIEILGKDYIDGLKRELGEWIFDVEVMNKRNRKVPNTFYPSFSEDRHVITPTHNYDSPHFPSQDIDPSQALITSWDFNAGFTSLVCGQFNTSVPNQFIIHTVLYEEPARTTTVSEADTTKTTIVEALALQFIHHFKSHPTKSIIIYGDASGNNRSAISTLTAYEQLQKVFQANGWRTTLLIPQANLPHHQKHTIINKIFEESEPHTPRIRLLNPACKYLIISISNSGIIAATFSKNKSTERTLVDQFYATHFSDAMDYLLIGLHLKPATSNMPAFRLSTR